MKRASSQKSEKLNVKMFSLNEFLREENFNELSRNALKEIFGDRSEISLIEILGINQQMV
jgi:hypothetical protein